MINVLKRLRLEKGFTQEYMAEKLGYSDKSGYNHIENGNVKLSLAKAIEIAKILDVNPSIFFEIEVQETSTNKDVS